MPGAVSASLGLVCLPQLSALVGGPGCSAESGWVCQPSVLGFCLHAKAVGTVLSQVPVPRRRRGSRARAWKNSRAAGTRQLSVTKFSLRKTRALQFRQQKGCNIINVDSVTNGDIYLE